MATMVDHTLPALVDTAIGHVQVTDELIVPPWFHPYILT